MGSRNFGKGRKFDFAHILMIDSLGYDKNYWIAFLAKYPFISKNMQITKVRKNRHLTRHFIKQVVVNFNLWISTYILACAT